ncbi:hypothetical protein ACFLXQ_07455 [Chloroflexota bacterium]
MLNKRIELGLPALSQTPAESSNRLLLALVSAAATAKHTCLSPIETLASAHKLKGYGHLRQHPFSGFQSSKTTGLVTARDSRAATSRPDYAEQTN